jgi:23S rRNA pseudouridine1911/1915/1917 synthase
MPRLDILYEDNHILVVNKPAGLLTQPSGTDQDSLETRCKAYLKEKYKKPGNVFLEAIHRLDKPVSGIVLFARTSKALSRLQASMRSKNCRKNYQALVEKAPHPAEGILEHALIHDEYKAAIVDPSHPQAKQARLAYRTKKQIGLYVWLDIELDTGRYHQIRAQFAAIGCPIVGDVKYGSTLAREDNQIALHHAFMQIEHPVSKETLTFHSPITGWAGYLPYP